MNDATRSDPCRPFRRHLPGRRSSVDCRGGRALNFSTTLWCVLMIKRVSVHQAWEALSGKGLVECMAKLTGRSDRDQVHRLILNCRARPDF